MNRKLYLFGMLAMVLLLASCKKEKETGSDPFNISAGIENDGSKTLLDGFKVKWILGDKIRVYDNKPHDDNYDGIVFTSKTLSNDDQTANFTCNASESIAESGSYWAIYPETGSYNRGTGLFSFNMPNTQTYHSNNTPMLFPMVATASKNAKGSGVFFYFQHAFGVLKISATGNTPITSIELTDANNYLSGNFTVRPDASTLNHVSGGSKTITMSVSNVTLTSTPTDFYFVLPAGSLSNGFTVKFLNNSGEVKTTSYPGTALEIIKATIHTATVDATKVHAFTVNGNSKKVVFAPGNLWSKNGKWYFEDEQYECHKSYTTSTNDNTSERGLFRWSSVNNPGGLTFNGYSPTFSDWGNLKIENDDQPQGTWCTLSINEWDYLCQHHTRFQKTINGQKGVVFLPDDFTGSQNDSWDVLESKGALFLPYGGAVYIEVWGNDSNERYNTYAWYWCSHVHPNNANYGQQILFYENNYNVDTGLSGDQKMQLSVRLARVVQ